LPRKLQGSSIDVATPVPLWCEQNLIVTVDSPDGHTETVIEKPFARIGSHRESEIVLPHPEVPARSLYLHATDAGVFCVDLSHPSEAGNPLHGWLPPDRVIRLGPYRLSARLDGAVGSMPGNDLDLQATGDCGALNPLLVVSVKDGLLGDVRLTRPLTIVGRRKPSKVRLKNQSVSSCHCALYWDSQSLWVIDLLSMRGTLVDGRSVEVAPVPPGSSMKLGPVTLTRQIETVERPLGVPPDGSDLTKTPESVALAQSETVAANVESEPEESAEQHADWRETRLQEEPA